MKKQIIIQQNLLRYEVVGTGQPVVLLHGFGENSDVWNNQVEFLKDSYQLIIPELPGSGQSAMIDDMSMEGMAEVIKQILDKERIEKCTLIGHSMGGYITLAFAEKYPEMLNGFGLFHSSAYADSEEKKATRKKGIAFIGDHGAFEFLKTATPNLFSARTKEERPELIYQQIAGLSNFLPPSLVSYYQAMMQRPDRTNLLKTSAVPVLFIMGEEDNAIPIKDVLEQCHLPGKSYIHVLNYSGHMGMLEEADKSNKALEQFLSEI
ncbi:MAG: alpha/beta hydrolase [Chitinophagales bacterium]|nr:alpha/beta hydrolase [Chitinophagales bacterium]